MGIRADFSSRDVLGHVERRIGMIEQLAVRRLAYIGEQAVNAARANGNYKDQTGNLRSSVGYAVSVNGRIVTASAAAQVFAPNGTGEEGKVTGEEYCRQLAARIPRGIALILVAGMEYAAAVYDKGYDVMTSGRLIAGQEVPNMLKKLGLGQ